MAGLGDLVSGADMGRPPVRGRILLGRGVYTDQPSCPEFGQIGTWLGFADAECGSPAVARHPAVSSVWMWESPATMAHNRGLRDDQAGTARQGAARLVDRP